MEPEVVIFFRKVLAEKKLINYEDLFNLFLNESNCALVNKFKGYNSLSIYSYFCLKENCFFLYKGYVFEKLPTIDMGIYQKIYCAAAFLLNCYEPLHFLELKHCIYHSFGYLKKEISILCEEVQNNLFKSIPFTEEDKEGYYVLVDDYRRFQSFYITTEEKTVLCIVATLMFYRIVHFEKLIKEMESRMPIEERAYVFHAPISYQFSFLKEHYPTISITTDGYVSLTKNFVFPTCSYETANKKVSLNSIESSDENKGVKPTEVFKDNLTFFSTKIINPEFQQKQSLGSKDLVIEKTSLPSTCSYDTASKKLSLNPMESSNINKGEKPTETFVDNPTTFPINKTVDTKIQQNQTLRKKEIITEKTPLLYIRFINGLSCLLNHYKYCNKEKITKLTLLVLEDVQNHLLHVPLLDRCRFLEDCFKHFVFLEDDVMALKSSLCDDIMLSEEEENSFLLVYILNTGGGTHYRKIFEKVLEYNKTSPLNMLPVSERFQYFKDRPQLYCAQQSGLIALSTLPSIDISISCFLNANQLVKQKSSVTISLESSKNINADLNLIPHYKENSHGFQVDTVKRKKIFQENTQIIEASNSVGTPCSELNLDIDNETTKLFKGETSVTGLSKPDEHVRKDLNLLEDEGNSQFSTKEASVEKSLDIISYSELNLPINNEKTSKDTGKSVAETSSSNRNPETCLNSLTDESNQTSNPNKSVLKISVTDLNSLVIQKEKSPVVNVEPSVSENFNFINSLPANLNANVIHKESSHFLKTGASILETSNMIQASGSKLNLSADEKDIIKLEKEEPTNEIFNQNKMCDNISLSIDDKKSSQIFAEDASLVETYNLNEISSIESKSVTLDTKTSLSFEKKLPVIESLKLKETSVLKLVIIDTKISKSFEEEMPVTSSESKSVTLNTTTSQSFQEEMLVTESSKLKETSESKSATFDESVTFKTKNRQSIDEERLIIESSNSKETAESKSVTFDAKTSQSFEEELPVSESSNFKETSESIALDTKASQSFKEEMPVTESSNSKETSESKPVTFDAKISKSFEEEMPVTETSNLKETSESKLKTLDTKASQSLEAEIPVTESSNLKETPESKSITLDTKASQSFEEEMPVSESSNSKETSESKSVTFDAKTSQSFEKEMPVTEPSNLKETSESKSIALKTKTSFEDSCNASGFNNHEIQLLNKHHCGLNDEKLDVDVPASIVQENENLKENVKEICMNEHICERLINGMTFLLKYFDLPVNSFFFEAIIYSLLDLRISFNELLCSCKKVSVLKYFTYCTNELQNLSKLPILKKVKLSNEEKISLFITFILIQKKKMKFRDLSQLVMRMEDKPESLSTNPRLYSFLKKNSDLFVLEQTEYVYLQPMQMFGGHLRIDYSNFISFVQLDSSKLLVPALNCDCREYRRLCAAVNFLLHYFNVLHYSELKTCIFYVLKDIEIYLSEFEEDTQDTIFKCVPFIATKENLFKLVKTNDIKMGFLTSTERFLLFASCILGSCDKIHFIELLKKYDEKHVENSASSLADLTFNDQVKYLNSLYPCILLDDHYLVKMPEDFKFPELKLENSVNLQSYDELSRNISWKFRQRNWDKNCNPDKTHTSDFSISDLDFKCTLKKICKKVTSSIAFLLQHFNEKSFSRLSSIILLVLEDVKWEFSILSVAKQSNILKECASLFCRNQDGKMFICSPDSYELCDLAEEEKNILLISFMISTTGEIHYRKIFHKYYELQGYFPKNLGTDSSHYSYLADRNGIFVTRRNGYFQLNDLPATFDSEIFSDIELKLSADKTNANLHTNDDSDNKLEEIQVNNSKVSTNLGANFGTSINSKLKFKNYMLSKKVTEDQLLNCFSRMKHGIFYLLNGLKLPLTQHIFHSVAYVLADVKKVVAEMSLLDRNLALNLAFFCNENSTNSDDYLYKLSIDLTDDEKKLLYIVALLSEKKKVNYKEIFSQLENQTHFSKNFELPKDLCNYMLEWNEKFSIDSEGYVTLLLFSEINFFPVTGDSIEELESISEIAMLNENTTIENNLFQTEFLQKLQTTLVFRDQLENILSKLRTFDKAFVSKYKSIIQEVIAAQIRSSIIYLSECFEEITYPFILSLVIHLFHNSEAYFRCLPSIEKFDLVTKILKPLTFDAKGKIVLNNAICSKIYNLNNDEKNLLIFAYKLAISNKILLSDLIKTVQKDNHSSMTLNSKCFETSYFKKYNEIFLILDDEHIKLAPFSMIGLQFKLFSQYFLLSSTELHSLLMEDNLCKDNTTEKNSFSELDHSNIPSEDTSISKNDDIIKQSERFGLIFSKALAEIPNDSQNCDANFLEADKFHLNSDYFKTIKKIHVGVAFLSNNFEGVAKSKPRVVLITIQCLDDVKKYLITLKPVNQKEFILMCLSSVVVKNGAVVFDSSLVLKLSNEEKLRLFSAYLLSFDKQMHYEDIYTMLHMKANLDIGNLSSVGKYISFLTRPDIFTAHHQDNIKLNPLFIIDMSGNYSKSSMIYIHADGSSSTSLQFTTRKSYKIKPTANLDTELAVTSLKEHLQSSLKIDNTINPLNKKAMGCSERASSKSLSTPAVSCNRSSVAIACGSPSSQLTDVTNNLSIHPKLNTDADKCMSITVTSGSTDLVYYPAEIKYAFKRIANGLEYFVSLNIPLTIRSLKIIVLSLHDVRTLYISLPTPNKCSFVQKCCEINNTIKSSSTPSLKKKEKCLLACSEKQLLCLAYALKQLGGQQHYRKVFIQALNLSSHVNYLLSDKEMFWYFKQRPEIFVINSDGFLKFVRFEFEKYRSKEFLNCQRNNLQKEASCNSYEQGLTHGRIANASEGSSSLDNLQKMSDKLHDGRKISNSINRKKEKPLEKSLEQEIRSFTLEKPIGRISNCEKPNSMSSKQDKPVSVSSKEEKPIGSNLEHVKAVTRNCESQNCIKSPTENFNERQTGNGNAAQKTTFIKGAYQNLTSESVKLETIKLPQLEQNELLPLDSEYEKNIDTIRFPVFSHLNTNRIELPYDASKSLTTSTSFTDEVKLVEDRAYYDNLIDSFLKCPSNKTCQQSSFKTEKPKTETASSEQIIRSDVGLRKKCASADLECTTVSSCDTSNDSVLNCSKNKVISDSDFKTDSVNQHQTTIEKIRPSFIHSPILEQRTLRFFIIILGSNNGVTPSFLCEKLKIASQEVQFYTKSKYSNRIISFFLNYPDIFHVSPFTKLIYLRSTALSGL